MKKSELKSTLGSIKADEGLVERTMLAVAERKRTETKVPFFARMSFGMRLAGAVCALLLTVTVAGAFLRGGIPAAEFGTDAQKAKESVVDTEAHIPTNTTSTRDTIDLLKEDALSSTGEWAIIKGSVFYASPSRTSEDGTYAVDVCITVIKHEESSEGIDVLSEDIDAYAVFSDESERQKLIDSLDEPVALLIEKDADNGEWKIKRIIY